MRFPHCIWQYFLRINFMQRVCIETFSRVSLFTPLNYLFIYFIIYTHNIHSIFCVIGIGIAFGIRKQFVCANWNSMDCGQFNGLVRQLRTSSPPSRSSPHSLSLSLSCPMCISLSPNRNYNAKLSVCQRHTK